MIVNRTLSRVLYLLRGLYKFKKKLSDIRRVYVPTLVYDYNKETSDNDLIRYDILLTLALIKNHYGIEFDIVPVNYLDSHINYVVNDIRSLKLYLGNGTDPGTCTVDDPGGLSYMTVFGMLAYILDYRVDEPWVRIHIDGKGIETLTETDEKLVCHSEGYIDSLDINTGVVDDISEYLSTVKESSTYRDFIVGLYNWMLDRGHKFRYDPCDDPLERLMNGS